MFLQRSRLTRTLKTILDDFLRMGSVGSKRLYGNGGNQNGLNSVLKHIAGY
jgi:hypothetical protein